MAPVSLRKCGKFELMKHFEQDNKYYLFFVFNFTFEMISNLVYCSSFSDFQQTVIFASVSDEFLTEAETMPHYQLNLGRQCLMVSTWPTAPCSPGSKQQGTPGDETEKFAVVSRRTINFIFH